MKRIVLAGGSGFLGQALARHLAAEGYEVVILTRSPGSAATGVRSVAWDGRTAGDWARWLDGAAAVVNLAGKNVNCRYTPANRREIVASRVDSVRALGEAIARCGTPPRAWVQAGSLAIYGDPGAALRDETAPAGAGFAAETCLLWEEAFDALRLPDTRKSLLRIAFVLGRDGGALEPLARLARGFLGGAAGSGRQYISWLHVDDLSRMLSWAIERDDVEGVFNATSPNPVTNAEFMRVLRAVLGRPWSPPVPALAVRLGARLMGTEASLVLTGRRCVPARFLEKGFPFAYPDLQPALRDLLRAG